jgi:RNA polymerase sigma-70 factor (ECF subfamily)
MPTPEQQDEERELRAAVLDGSAAAWRTLFDRHFGPLYGYVLRRAGRDRAWAEDVTQETWLLAARDLRRFQPAQATFAAWLRGIAENQLRNQRRREARRRSEGLDGNESGDGAELRAHDLREGIAVTFAALPENYQNVLRAKYEDQLPIAEIAAEWGATSKSIESLLGRARAAFREMYRRLCGETEDDRGEA